MLTSVSDVSPHDYSGLFFIGVVVHNDDPLNLRRVKVTVPNLYVADGSNFDKLPWIAPFNMGLIANTIGQGGTYPLAPQIGSKLIVTLQQGDPLHGIYIGSPLQIDHVPTAFRPVGVYGFEDPAGNVFIVDTRAGQERITVQHASGTIVRIEETGKVRIDSTEGFVVEAQGAVSISSLTSITLTAPAIDWNS